MGPRRCKYYQNFKVQHSKGIANILADSVSRLGAVVLYHYLDFKDGQQEFGTPFEPCPQLSNQLIHPLKSMKFVLNLT